jgi:hypothetical protein
MKTTTIICTIFCICCMKIVIGQQSIDNYVLSPEKNSLVLIASAANSLTSPVDIDFYPDQSKRPAELWILNQGTDNTGGSTVIVSNANNSTRTYKYVIDGNAWHFMAMASAMAFGDSNWATSQDIMDANRSGGIYTGPTLWPGDLDIYGVVGNPASAEFNGSHLSMVHQSPYGKGIAFEKGNVYWVMDGYEGNIKRYDFGIPHYPGGDDHSGGSVQVYTGFSFTRHTTLPGHIAIDSRKKYLYGCDVTGKKIFRIDITTGSYASDRAKLNEEHLDGYYTYDGLQSSVVIDAGLTAPVGIDVYGDRLIVTDNGSREIIIYNIADNYKEIGRIKVSYAGNPDLMGVKVGPDGKIYFADKTNRSVYMIENTAVVPVAVKKIYEASDIALVYPNPFNDRLFISLKENTGNAEVSVTNILGQVVYTGGINGANKTIDFSALKSGVYFLQIETSDKRLTQKIIKQ